MSSNTINWRSIFSLSSIIYTILGVISALIALQGFMIPNHFLDGGVTGISILMEEVFHIPFSISLILFNLPFIYLGYRKIGKTFSVKAFLAVILLAILMTFITFPQVTSDKVLIAVFGGFFIGLGIGLVIRGGGVIDGLEIIAHYTNKRVAFSTSEIIMSVNTLLFIGAAFEFGIETAMYSILVYYTAMKTSDYVVDGFEEFTALSIISKDLEKVKSIIVDQIKQVCDIVMTIVMRIEIH